jgi:putative transposase
MMDILRAGAQKMLAQMIQQEVDDWLGERANLQDEQGRRQVVRYGFLPKREIVTGVGLVEVQQPRVRDRRPANQAEPFTSKILPPYLRKTKSIEELIPWLYLKGVSTGDFSDALMALVGAGRSASVGYDRYPTEDRVGRRIPGVEQTILGWQAAD